MTTPCVQTESISKIKESVALTNKDISYMKLEISEIKQAQVSTNEKLDTLIEKMETKFAAKWVEIAVKGFMGIVFAYVIYYILDRTLKGL